MRLIVILLHLFIIIIIIFLIWRGFSLSPPIFDHCILVDTVGHNIKNIGSLKNIIS